MLSSRLARCFLFFFFNDTATTEIYTLSLHDALPILVQTSLMVSHDHLAFAASEHERRACGPASQGGVLREVVRRNHDTGIAPPEHPDLVVQIFEGLRIPGRVALATSQRLGDPVLGLRVPGIIERTSAWREQIGRAHV